MPCKSPSEAVPKSAVFGPHSFAKLAALRAATYPISMKAGGLGAVNGCGFPGKCPSIRWPNRRNVRPTRV